MKNQIRSTVLAAVLGLGLQANASLKLVQAEMNAFQQPQVDAFRQVLEKDKELSPEYKIFVSELAELAKIKNPEERMKKGIAVNEKHKSLFEKAMKKSKGDPEAIKKHAKKMEKKYSSKKIRYHIISGDFLTYIVWLEQLSQQEEAPQETEVTFQAPFEFEHSSQGGNGRIDVDLEAGTFLTHADTMFIGSFKNKAGLGDYVRIPWATENIRVSAKLPETSVYLIAYAGPGGAGATGSSVIDVLTEDGEQCEKIQEHGAVVAPVVWHAKLEMDDTTIMACEMESPPANQDVAVRFQSIADVTSGGVAFGYGTLVSTPAPVRVRLIE